MTFNSLLRITLAAAVALSAACATSSKIPDWYTRDIAQPIQAAVAVILYRTESVTLESYFGPYFTYRINTATVAALKGFAPDGACYLFHTEGKWDHSNETGEQRLVILLQQYESECGVIEPGYSAPGSDDYVDLFKTIIANGA